MKVFFLTLALLLIVFIAMSIGYLVKKKSIAGSCGGLGALGIAKACNCENPCDRRKERLAKEEQWQQNKII